MGHYAAEMGYVPPWSKDNEPIHTPWFRWPARPVREGWYEFRGLFLADRTMMYWNGHQFGYWHGKNWIYLADDNDAAWRGLTKPA